MSFARHNRRGRQASCIAATTLIAAVLVVIASRPAAAAPPPADAWPDAESIVNAYSTVREWLETFSLPSPREDQARVTLPGASGVCLVLRRTGRPIGSGVAVGGDPGMVRRAAGRAFGTVLADPRVANLPDSLRATIGTSLTLELEVAGPPRPLLGQRLGQIERGVDPGLAAVALRRGDRWSMVLPSQMRASGRSPNLAAIVRGLAVDLDLPPLEPIRLRREHGVGLYLAPTVHLAQEAPGKAPFQTFRGQHLVPSSAVTPSAIATAADALALRILGSLVTPPADRDDAPVGFAGDYLPGQQRYQPPLARPLEQALLSLALAAYAPSPGVSAEVAREARAGAIRTLRELARTPEFDIATSAAIVLAASQLDPVTDDGVAALVGRVTARLDADAAPEDRPGGHALALVAAAQTRRLVRRDGVDLPRVRHAIDDAWASATGPEMLSLLPWIAWAELDWSAATGTPVAHREELRSIRRLLESCLVGGGYLDGPPDLEGGFALNALDISGRRAVRATAQSLRPAAALAKMLREPSLTDAAEAPAALGRHLRTVRFVMQLTVRPESLWCVPDRKRALGGIRAAPWESRQPAAAQAMGLLALSETLHALKSGTPPRTTDNVDLTAPRR